MTYISGFVPEGDEVHQDYSSQKSFYINYLFFQRHGTFFDDQQHGRPLGIQYASALTLSDRIKSVETLFSLKTPFPLPIIAQVPRCWQSRTGEKVVRWTVTVSTKANVARYYDEQGKPVERAIVKSTATAQMVDKGNLNPGYYMAEASIVDIALSLIKQLELQGVER